MSSSTLLKYLNPPADDVAIDRLIKAVGQVPDGFAQLLRETNGGQVGFTDRDGDNLVLWKAEQIAEMNAAYEIGRWCPALLAIGSDGGDDAIGFDRSAKTAANEWPVVRVGFGNLDPDCFERLADTFAAWVESRLALSPGE